MISGLFVATFGSVALMTAMVGAILSAFAVVVFLVCYRLRLPLDRHFYPVRPELLDEYADHAALADEVGVRGDRTEVFEAVPDEPFPAESAPDLDEDRVVDEDTGRHSLAMVAPTQGLTGYIPVVSAVDDERALAAVRAVSGGDGAR